jgi:Tfp pilus assembly protein PilW
MLNRARRAGSRGETLAGLLVGITVGMIVVATVVAMLVSTLNLNSQALKNSYLNQELKAIMDMMVRDIRRAQYSGNVSNCIGGEPCANQFTGDAEDWTLSPTRIEYTYDKDSNGMQDSGECSGFRRRVESDKGKVEKKYSCESPNWQSLSDANVVNVVRLRFSSGTACIPSGGGFLTVREVKIYLEGVHAGATRRMCQKVRIKNDLRTATCTAAELSDSSPFDLCPP